MAFESFSEWIQILLALVGLVGGPAAGTFYGGVRRARLEDRRELLRAWIPWLPDIFKSAPPPAVTSIHEHVPTGLDRTLGRTGFALRDMNNIVRQLPWKDRLLWIDIVQGLASPHPRFLHQLTLFTGEYRLDGLLVEQKAQLTKEFDEFNRNFAGRQHLELVSRFETHLLRKVNPTMTSRARDVWLAVVLLPRRISTWRLSQPARMDLGAIMTIAGLPDFETSRLPLEGLRGDSSVR